MSLLYRNRPQGAFSPLPSLAEPLGGDMESLKQLLPQIGFRRQGEGEGSISFTPQRRGAGKKKPKQRQEAGGQPKRKAKQQKPTSGKKPAARAQKAANPDSPFAKLAEIYGR